MILNWLLVAASNPCHFWACEPFTSVSTSTSASSSWHCFSLSLLLQGCLTHRDHYYPDCYLEILSYIWKDSDIQIISHTVLTLPLWMPLFNPFYVATEKISFDWMGRKIDFNWAVGWNACRYSEHLVFLWSFSGDPFFFFYLFKELPHGTYSSLSIVLP